MEDNIMGLLRIRVRKGINLAVRDSSSSDPYVVITMAEQKLKTRVVKNDCNPEWNDELTLCIKDPNLPINLAVYDKDTFTKDDEMGDARIDYKPCLDCMNMNVESQPDDTVVSRVQPNIENCLAKESCIVWKNGKIVQDMYLKLRNVECGEVEVQLELINFSGSKST